MIFTLGHSNHTWQSFAALIQRAGIERIVDVRSAPASKYSPHFNREFIEPALVEIGCSYCFMGLELGGRPSNAELFTNGVADFALMASTDEFAAAIDSLIDMSRSAPTALMCAEKDPMDCHRCLLVGRHLHGRGESVRHVLFDGTIETQQDVEKRMLKAAGLDADDLFRSHDERVDQAYALRNRRVGFALAPAPTP